MTIEIVPLDKAGYYRAEIFLGREAEEDPESYCVGFCAAGCLYDGVVSGFETLESALKYVYEVRRDEYDWYDNYAWYDNYGEDEQL